MADLGTVILVTPPPMLSPAAGNLQASLIVPISLDDIPPPPFTGIPVTGQIWPRSRTTVEEGVGEGMNREAFVISTNTTLAADASTDYVYVCTAALTATLPTAVGNTNLYTVKNVGAGAVVTVQTTSSQTIDGASTFVIGVRYQAVGFVSDGSNWLVL